MLKMKQLCVMMACTAQGFTYAYANEAAETDNLAGRVDASAVQTLDVINIVVSADASADGLMKPYAGGQVATGGKIGIFGNQKNLDTPFNITSYTNQYIQDRQAQSVGEVLQADAGVRTAKGYGNFQEAYFIRGFALASDDTAYNGLYGILPRQYIPTELFERVEVFKGASAFLNGAIPGGTGIGGSINLLPKRASNDLISADYKGDQFRLSGDLGYNNNRLSENRPSLRLTNAVTQVPSASQYANYHGQAWTYSNEEDLFGSIRAEYDLTDATTAYAAYGFRKSEEAGVYSSQQLSDTATGAAKLSASVIPRKDTNHSAELGLKTKFETGNLKHQVVVSGSLNRADKRYNYGYATSLNDNFYDPIYTENSNIDKWLGEVGAYPKAGLSTLKSIALGDNISMLDDRLTLMLGARYQEIDQDVYSYGTYKYNINKNQLTPALGVSYKLSPEWSMYANYIEALVQGDAILDSEGNNYIADPFVSKQKEVGLKFENGLLGGTLNYFYTDRQKASVNTYAYGQLSDSIKILGGATWIDTQQKNTYQGLFEGHHVIGVPEFQANVEADWKLPTEQDISVNGRVVYTGSTYANNANTLKLNDWTRVDVGANYKTQINTVPTTLNFSVTNVLDKDYWASASVNDYTYLSLSEPRTFKLSATFDF